jgi:hypothetical protein
MKEKKVAHSLDWIRCTSEKAMAYWIKETKDLECEGSFTARFNTLSASSLLFAPGSGINIILAGWDKESLPVQRRMLQFAYVLLPGQHLKQITDITDNIIASPKTVDIKKVPPAVLVSIFKDISFRVSQAKKHMPKKGTALNILADDLKKGLSEHSPYEGFLEK